MQMEPSTPDQIQGPPAPTPDGSGPAPGQPMAQNADPKGLHVVATATIRTAMSLMAKALFLFGPDSEKGALISSALHRLAGRFGSSEEDDIVPQVALEAARTAARNRATIGALPPGAAAPQPGGMSTETNPIQGVTS